MEVICQQCGKRFDMPRSQAVDRKFCSKACFKKNHRPTLICIGCGKSFEHDPKKPKVYCSFECFKKSRHVTLICSVCGKEFDSYLSEQHKRKKNNHVPCCSRACRNRYTSLLLGGDGNWIEGGKYNTKRSRGKGWRKTRNDYLKSIGYVCEGCGQNKATEVHHLMPTANGGSLTDFDNLMAVCKDCHENMHFQLRRGDFKSEVEAYLHENH